MMCLYIVMINVNPGLTIVDVQNALTNGVAWYRIASNVWLVHTNLGKEWICDVLLPLANPSGTLFVAPLEMSDQFQGWMTQDFWDWINPKVGRTRRR